MKGKRAPEVGPEGLEQKSNGRHRVLVEARALSGALTSLEPRGRLSKAKKGA